jgi:hypothetical protein
MPTDIYQTFRRLSEPGRLGMSMQLTAVDDAADLAPRGFPSRAFARLVVRSRHRSAVAVEDRLLVLILHAYGQCCGVATADELAGLLRVYANQPISVLARWIVARRVVSFVWQSETWIPLFQFDLADMSLRQGALQVIRELVEAFDDWELATWFASPNPWLQDAAPLEIILDDPSAVLDAARADRFVAMG